MIYAGLFALVAMGFGYGFIAGRYSQFLFIGDISGMMDAFHDDLKKLSTR